MQKKYFALCLACLLLFFHEANALPAQWAFRITFSNKNGTLDINNPHTFLSQRALDRRAKYGIAIDSLDLPISPAYVDSALSLTHGILHLKSKWLNECVILLADSAQILNLQDRSFIYSINCIAYYPSGLHNKAAGNSKFEIENKPSKKTTGDSSYYNTTWHQTNMVNGDCLHDQGYKGLGKLIAVLDLGFPEVNTLWGFDSLRRSGRLIDSFNFVSHIDSVFRYGYHGTETLSTMAGYIPDSFIGTAPLAEYALYITEDISSEQPIEMDNMLAGSERADSIGADIISTSLGYGPFDAPLDISNLTYADLDGRSTIAAKAANIATQKGIVFVVSAGNDGTSSSLRYVHTPADADSALTIGAVNYSGIPAPFSSYGPNFSGQIKPDICALGVSTSIFLCCNNVGIGSGTSYAAPQMAGWAACLLQYLPTATPYLIRKAIDSSADHYFNPGPQIGYGIPDICKAAEILYAISPTYISSPEWMLLYPTYFSKESSLNLTVNLLQNENVSFVLTDVTGRKIVSSTQPILRGRQNISCSVPAYLSPGIYIFRAATSSKKYTTKLVKY